MQLPWTTRVYRNRHGRGLRRPLFNGHMPRYRTAAGMFDDMVASQIRRLSHAWPDFVNPVQVAVEDVPPSDPAPWEGDGPLFSRAFPANHGMPARVVLYRLPIQSQTGERDELELMVRDELVSRIAELYGRRPEEIDPMWGQ